jgi:hypothetical protein
MIARKLLAKSQMFQSLEISSCLCLFTPALTIFLGASKENTTLSDSERAFRLHMVF